VTAFGHPVKPVTYDDGATYECRVCGQGADGGATAIWHVGEAPTSTVRTLDAITNEAIERVDRHADMDWKDAALDAVYRLAQSAPTFTAEAAVALIPDGYSTHEGRAMGPVMRRAQAAGWCEPTDHTVSSQNAAHHKGIKRVWRSRLYPTSAPV
jgi:hypothetical protein